MPAVQHQLPTVEEVSMRRDRRGHHEGDARRRHHRSPEPRRPPEWCLPKGHPEGVENSEEAAVREIAEETGIEGRIVSALGSIDYWFTVSGHRVHKTVHHFLLIATGGCLTIENDPDHEAVDVAWVPLQELGRKLSFPNERRIADLAREVLPEHL